MFVNLKRKFVIINMSLLSFVFITIFVVTYILLAVSGERQVAENLRRIMNSPPGQQERLLKPSVPRPGPPPGDPERATSLVVDLDKEGNIINVFSFMELEEATIEKAVLEATEAPKNSANIKVDDIHYAFLKQASPRGMRIVFVDRSPFRDTLIRNLVVFGVTGGISLILLFMISVYLANRTIRPIKEAFEKQQQFVADAAHELKTPLTIIKTNLDVISANENESVKSQGKWLGFIASQTERMSTLINDMLSLARMDSPEYPLLHQRFNLSNALNGTLLSFEAPVFEAGLLLQTEIRPDIHIYGDKGAIEQLLAILMDNAIKNTPRGGTISVNLNSEKNKIKIVLTNSGATIPEKDLDKIFHRFYRLDSSRSRESGGYGLGLAIAKSIVNQHQGKIYARSSSGAGTSFIVELPYNRQ